MHEMTSQWTASGRFTSAIRARHLLNAEIAARKMGEFPLGYLAVEHTPNVPSDRA
jgi:hypothetical protein